MSLAFAAYGSAVMVLIILSSVIGRRSSLRSYVLIAIAVVVGLLAQLIWTHPHYLTYIFPFSGALFFVNLFPFAVALALPAAVRVGKGRVQRIRIGVLMAALLGVSLIGTYRLSGTPVTVGETQYWADGTCRQTSIDTCSAAATVTLLKESGIDATEKQIARWALTHEGRGTHPLGIYRALKLAVAESTSTARVRFRAINAADLLAKDVPAIVNVGLIHAPVSDLEHRLVAEAQWEPGVVHSVVYMGRQDGKVRIADPDFGEELWPEESFRTLYRGTALWLEP